MRQPHALGVLREGSFARYLGATAVSTLGSGMSSVALAFAVLAFGGATDLGIVLLGREIPMIVFLLLGGVFADRLRRRTILVSTDLVKGAAQVATAALLLTGTANAWNVALVQMVFGIAAAFSRPATLGLIREAVPDERLQEANALTSLAQSVMFVVGPAAGAIVVAAWSPAAALGLDAVSFFASATLVASMHLAPTVRLAASSILADLRGGWGEFVSRPWAVAMVASFGLFQLTYFPALSVLGPVIAKNQLGGPGSWGLILSSVAIGAVVGGMLALRLRFRRPLVASELLVLPAGLLLMGFAVPLHVLALAGIALVAGVGFALGGTLWETALQRNVPIHALSRISSFDWLGSVALNPIGYAVIGPLAGAIGAPQALVLSGALNVAVCLSVLLLPSVRAIGMQPPAAALTGQAGGVDRGGA